MLIPFGVLSAAGAGGVVGTYELIETQILGSSQSSITFSNLGTYSSTYKHLQIRLTARGSNNATWEINEMRFNGDSGANYANHLLRGGGSTVSSSGGGGGTSIGFETVGNTAPSGAFAAVIIDILDAYSTTKNKTTRTIWGRHNASDNAITLTSGLWQNTNAISSIVLTDGGGARSFLTGSRFSIYGIRG